MAAALVRDHRTFPLDDLYKRHNSYKGTFVVPGTLAAPSTVSADFYKRHPPAQDPALSSPGPVLHWSLGP